MMSCDSAAAVEPVVAQVVLRDTKGRSIMDSEQPLLQTNIQSFTINQQRVDMTAERLAVLGFDIADKGPHTLSVCGPRSLFAETFGLSSDASSPDARQAVIPSELEELIADVIIPIAPTLFP